MKKIINILFVAVLALNLSSCWEEDDFEAGAPRHQVTDLKVSPGDCEAELRWTMPDGWNPTDFIITYSDVNQETQTIRTGGEMTYLVPDLQNGFQYTFKVQAVYGTLISQAVEAVTTPATSRFPTSDLAAEGSDGMVNLTWTKPGTAVNGYTLTYCREDSPADVATVEIAADVEAYTVENLENDVYYSFTMVAHYPKGASDPTTVRAMPTLAIPYFVDRTDVSVGQPVIFTFNREDLANATDVSWTFPDGTVLTGDVVSGSFSSANPDSRVILSAKLGTVTKTWPIVINVRQYVVWFTDWTQDGTNYNGFKGTCPVFSPDGKNAYIVTFNKVSALYSFDLISGELNWRYVPETKTGSYNMLTVNPVSGDIYYGTTSNGHFYCVTSDGALRWHYKSAGSMQAAAPAVSADGATVYISDKEGRTAAIDASTGSERWNKALGAAGCGIIVSGNDVVVGTKDAVYFLDAATGNEVKKLAFKAAKTGMTDISGFAVAADKRTVYVPQLTGLISSFDLQSREWIVKDFPVGGNNLYEPVVSPNGDVFVGSKDSKCYIISGDLTSVKVTIQCPGLEGKNNGYNYSHPVVDADGNFYITSGQVKNVCLKIGPSGNILEKWDEGDSANQKQMGGNNFIDGILFSAFIGASNDNGVFVGKYVGGRRADTWSTHGGDICGSCCVK